MFFTLALFADLGNVQVSGLERAQRKEHKGISECAFTSLSRSYLDTTFPFGSVTYYADQGRTFISRDIYIYTHEISGHPQKALPPN